MMVQNIRRKGESKIHTSFLKEDMVLKKRDVRKENNLLKNKRKHLVLETASVIQKSIIFCIMLFIFLANSEITGFVTSFASNQLKVKLETQYGLSKEEARDGRVCTFEVNVTALKEPIEGILELTIAKKNSQGSAKYSMPISLGTGEQKTFFFSVQVREEFFSYRISVKTEKEEILAEKTAPLHVINYGSYKQLGVISKKTEGYSYLKDFGSVVYFFNDENFLEAANHLSALDLLIIDEIDGLEFSKEQIKRVQEWVEAGGLLILGANVSFGTYKNIGEQLGKVSLTFQIDAEEYRNLKEQINDYEHSRSSAQIQVNEIRKNYGIELPIYVGESMLIGRTLNNMKLMPIVKSLIQLEAAGHKVYLREENNILVTGEDVKKGRVLFFAFPLSFQEPVWMAYQTWLVNWMINQMSETGKNQINAEEYGYFNNYSIENILSISNTKNMPSIGKYSIVFFVYLVIAAPILHFLLKRYELSKYIWGIIPVLAVIFTFIIYLGSSSTRVKEPYYGYFDLEYLESNIKKSTGAVNFFVSIPNNQGHKFTLENSSSLLIDSNSNLKSYYFNTLYQESSAKVSLPAEFENYTSKIIYSGKETEVEVRNVPAFSRNYFTSYYNVDYSFIPNGSVEIDADSITGTITNEFDFVLEDVGIYSNYIYVELGDIEVGKTIEFSEQNITNMINRDMIYLMGNKKIEEHKEFTKEEKRRVYAIQYALDKLYESKESYLIGFKEGLSEQNPLSAVSLGENSYGVTLFLILLETKNNIQEDKIGEDGIQENTISENSIQDSTADKEDDIQASTISENSIQDSTANKEDNTQKSTVRENTVQDSIIIKEENLSVEIKEEVFVPDMEDFMEVIEGEYESESYRYITTETMIVNYHFPREDKITSFLLTSMLNKFENTDYIAAMTGSISFYNYNTKEYDFIFTCSEEAFEKTQEISGEKLINYLDSENNLIVKFENTEIPSFCVLPRISYRKEVR